MPLDSARIHEVPDDLLAAIDYCFEEGWTDGLPVVPRRRQSTAWRDRDPDARHHSRLHNLQHVQTEIGGTDGSIPPIAGRKAKSLPSVIATIYNWLLFDGCLGNVG
jgi:hypothetical protein